MARKKTAVPQVPTVVNTPVQIRVPHDSRLRAIETLSEAVLAIARALNVSTQVHIANSNFYQADIGISVTSEQKDFERADD